jgi:hypothetical protein
LETILSIQPFTKLDNLRFIFNVKDKGHYNSALSKILKEIDKEREEKVIKKFAKSLLEKRSSST